VPNPELPDPAGRRWPASIERIALAVALPALAVLLLLGNDASWDLRNYHLYGPHAWLHGRLAIDIAAAQMQGYHNPLLDLPMYLLARAGAHPKLIGLWLALPAMFALWCLLRLQQKLSPAPPGPLARLFLLVFALSGAATWSTLGMSSNDAFLAAGMLGALVLLLDAPGPSSARCFGAGAIAGATAGLKLAGAFYCPALALALLCLPGSARTRATRLLMLAAGGLAGFALSYGWWGWQLWQAHANPFFPYFNQWFASPELAPQSWVDLRFRPQGPLEILLAPLRLLFRSQRFSEAGMKDPRLLLALLGFAWLAWKTRAGAMRALLAFVGAAALGWALQSGIYRYAIAIELLGALALMLSLARLPRWRCAAMALALLLVSVDTRRPDWHRVDSVRGPMPVLDGALPKDALVVTATGEPLGYLALALPDTVPMLGLDNNLVQPGDWHDLPRRAARRVDSHRGPIYLAGALDAQARQRLQRWYGLDPTDHCLVVRSTLGDQPLCELAAVHYEGP
jgi:hypothetical protein